MKSIFLSIVLFLFSSPLLGQNLIQNGGFETVSTPVPECEFPFRNPTAVNNWTASHGTPQLFGGIACGNQISNSARSGSYFAFMAASPASVVFGTPAVSEGIYQTFNFQTGKAYRLSFYTSNGLSTSATKYVVEAANGIQPYLGVDGDVAPNIPSNQRQLIYNGITTQNWQQTVTNFFPSQNFSQLWFYAGWDQTSSNVGVSLDDVEVVEISAINQISGTSGLVCSSGSQFQSIISSSYYNWSSPTGNLSISGSGNTVTVTPTGSGNATLCVQVDNGQTYCTQFWTGPPAINNILVYNNYNQPTNSTNMCNGSGLNVQANATQASNYSWNVSCCNSYLTDYGNGIAYFNSYNNDCYGLTVTATNTCGNTQNGVTICVEDCFYFYTVFPNPSKDHFYIEFEKTDNLSSLPERLELLSEKSTNPIMSINMQEVHERKGFKNGNRLEFDIKHLPRGVYYLHVFNYRRKGNEKESIRLIFE